MAEFYDENMEQCDENEAAYALIRIQEYNGLCKALRLYKNTKSKEIKESEGGYKPLEQSTRKHIDDRSKYIEWLTVLQSPYSCDAEYETARELILHDLVPVLGTIPIHDGTMDAENLERDGSMEYQKFKMGRLSSYGIFDAAIKYNGRSRLYEVHLRSIRNIPLGLLF